MSNKIFMYFALSCFAAFPTSAHSEAETVKSEIFIPYPSDEYVSTNGISFSHDGRTVYMALRRKTDDKFALYSAHCDNNRWSEPQLLPFSKEAFNPYEPTLSPDGSFLVFNSRHPLPGIADESLDGPRLWMSEKRGASWEKPVPFLGVTSEKFSSSYATFTDNGDLYFFSSSMLIPSRPSGIAEEAGQPVFEAIYFAKKTETGYGPPILLEDLLPLSKTGQKIGVGDPWIAPDGTYMIYTLYDDAVGWGETVDLVISFATDEGWTSPVKLDAINTNGADNSPSATHDGEWFYYRSSGQLRRTKLQPLLDSVKR